MKDVGTLKMEVGKFYRTRDGRKVGPMRQAEWPDLMDGNADEVVYLFNKSDGTHGDRDSDDPFICNKPDLDIIAEWNEEATPAPTATTPTQEPDMGTQRPAHAVYGYTTDREVLAHVVGALEAIEGYRVEEVRAFIVGWLKQ